MMNKLFYCGLIIAIIAFGSAFDCSSRFVSAQTGTYVGGLISEDTTWTKANSPYIFNSSVEVGRGVTLTIEAGTTTRNSLGLYINGTLAARGTSTDPIVFDHGLILFLPWSVGWDEQSQTGSIVEYVTIYDIDIQSASPKLNHVTVPVFRSTGGKPLITNSNIGLTQISGPATVLNNQFTDTFIAYGDLTISGNQITGSTDNFALLVNGSATITGNTIIGGGTYQQYPSQTPQRIAAFILSAGSPYVSNNIITGRGGISVSVVNFVETLQISNNN